MSKDRNFDPLDPLPANWTDSFQELVSGMVIGLRLIIKPGAANTLQVPAGAGNDQVGLVIEGRHRWVSANVERVGSGAARTVEVWATASDNVFTPGTPGEIDSTVRSFDLAVVDVAGTPAGAIKRKLGTALWSGSQFTMVDQTAGVRRGDPPLLTSLPGSPYDGQIVDLLVDAAGAYGGPYVWRVRYRSSGGTQKWEVVGEAAPLMVFDNSALGPAIATPGSQINTAAGTRVGIPVPFTGSYTAEGQIGVTAGGADVDVSCGIRQGTLGTASVSGQSVPAFKQATIPLAMAFPDAVVAGVSINVFAAASGAANAGGVFLAVRPLRLG